MKEETSDVSVATPVAATSSSNGMDKKVIIVAGVAIVVLVGAGLLVWQLFFSRPSPKQLCEKSRTLAEQFMKDELEMDDETIKEAIDDEYDLEACIKEIEKSREEAKDDKEEEKELIEMEKCVMEAEDFEDMIECMD